MNRVEYRCVLLRPHSRAVLAFADASGVHLPRVHIPPAARPAYELQRAIRNRWGLNIFVLDASPALDGFEGCAIAELLASPAALKFSDVLIEQLIPSELSEGEWGRLQLLLKERPEKPICHFGWVDEAVAWIESATGRRFSSKQSLKQANAGGGFALFRVRSDDGRHYWLKATAEPNAHEYRITEFLAELCPEYLPKLVATRKEWNAWLTEDAGRPISNPPGPAELDAAAAGMAQFQLRTIGLSDDLLNRGASDHRLPVLRSAIDSVIGYLIEAMSRQTSTKAIPISRNRLLELATILHETCFRMEALHIPDALLHNDLNSGNILSDGTHCVFIDWCETSVGNPFLSCERLCQLNQAHAESARKAYRDIWLHRLSTEQVDEAVRLAPLLAIYAYLYGRGEWLLRTQSVSHHFEGYARSLARHMDRAAKGLSFMEALCP